MDELRSPPTTMPAMTLSARRATEPRGRGAPAEPMTMIHDHGRDTSAGFFRWAWQHIATAIQDVRPGQANLTIEGTDRSQRVTARLIIERRGLEMRGIGEDPVEAVEQLVRNYASVQRG